MLEREPEVDVGTSILARAYAQLSSERHNGFGMGPIPWTKMIEWCKYHGMGRDTTDHLVNVLCRVDLVYIRRSNAKSTTPRPSRPSRNEGKRGTRAVEK